MEILKKWGIWVLFLGLLIFLTFNKHSKSELFSYQSVIHADKAGYYIYLPAVLHGMDIKQLPEDIAAKTGEGFRIDAESNTFQSKYTSGVAIMELPFFLVAHLVTIVTGGDQSGFTPVYYAFVNIASVFYLWLALMMLYKVLRTKFSNVISIAALLLTLTGTNLYYYSIDETGMSHVYSFALFSAFIYLFTFIEKYKKKQVRYVVSLAFVCAMIVLIRPSNLVFLLIVLLFNYSWLKENNWLFRPRILLLGIFIGVLVFLPQFLYWRWAYGDFVTYSYGNESFSNWNHPYLLETWFAPNNGLFCYNPVVVFILLGAVLMLLKKKIEGVIGIVAFMFVSYLTASWWTYSFGCGYGARNFVEYFSILIIPFAYLLQSVEKTKWRFIVYPLVLVCVVFNMDMIYAWDECWFGNGDWNWEEYWRLVRK